MIQTIRSTTPRLRFDLADPQDHISRRIIRFRDFYERDLLDDLRARVSGGVAIDVGAHIGNHTVWMAGVCGLDVVAIEPNPASRAQLERNVALNRLSKRVRVVAAAVGATVGRARIDVPNPANTGMACAVIDSAGDVPVTTIDELAITDVSVIKVDVEGAELDILQGARGTIRRCHPVLYIEAQTEERRAAVDAFLGELGYRRFGQYAITPTYGYAPQPTPVAADEIRLSVAIMAHPKREAFVQQLLSELDGDATVVWDERRDRWDTGRRSLLAYDPDATHHLVIQDDAVVCKDLLTGVREALRRNPHCPMSLYMGRQRPHSKHFDRVMRDAQAVGATWIVGPELCWGVALCFPTQLIESMVASGDQRKHVQNYDKRLAMYLIDQKIPTWYTVPSLVDHRRQEESPSLVPGRNGPNRVARTFLGASSALEVDWDAGLLVLERRPGIDTPTACPTCGSRGFTCGTAADTSEPLLEVGV